MQGEAEVRVDVLRAQGALAVLGLVHRRPGITRSDVARTLSLSSGSATEIVGRLKDRHLLTEVEPPGKRSRGRPSMALVPHPDGPVVAAAEITRGGWRVAAVELGGTAIDVAEGRHETLDAPAAIAAVRSALRELHRELDGRLRAIGVSVPGTVAGGRLLLASTLRWRDVDLAPLVPPALRGIPLRVGNDATLSGLAEARRGAARDAPVALYLTIEVGIGGVELVDGRPVAGASGNAGEFGHMPFGEPGRRCPCGASACWDLEVDGRALARILGRHSIGDPRRFAGRVIDAARRGRTAELSAVVEIGRALGRGTGALVNALDPTIVVYGGLAPDIVALASREVERAYRAALMRHLRGAPPPIEAAALGRNGSLLGAAELAFDAMLGSGSLALASSGRV